MTTSPTAPAVERDLPCTGCGYNLRGLPEDGRCPECGRRIERSLHGHLLKYADPVWLAGLARGTHLLVTLLLLAFFGPSALVALRAIAGGSGRPGVMMVIELALVVLLAVVGFRAMHQVTIQEPRAALQESDWNLRRVIFFCAVITVVSHLVGSVQMLGSLPNWLLIAEDFFGLVVAVVIVGLGIYYRRFALRIPAQELAQETRVVVIGWCVVIGLAFLLSFSTAVAMLWGAVPGAAPPAAGGSLILEWQFAGRSGPVPFSGLAAGVFTGGACLMAVGVCVFGLWSFSLLSRYARILRETVEEAKALDQDQSDGSSNTPATGESINA